MFSVNLKLYFVCLDESSNKFKVYVDKDGNFPKVDLEEEGEIEDYIFEKSLDLFYGSVEALLTTARLSEIEKNNEKITLIYNIFCYNNIECKEGEFVSFDKNSIELYRFANNQGR
jgi:hypothetical protein|tara:strand:- start:1135 stop:1479 length:345 start_codon:yes stop_codon:yes gene_type:complete